MIILCMRKHFLFGLILSLACVNSLLSDEIDVVSSDADLSEESIFTLERKYSSPNPLSLASISAVSVNEYNGLIINSLYYDTSSARIHISYCFDDSVIDISNLEVAVTYDPLQYSTQPGNFPTITVLGRCTDTVIPLVEPLRFDTLYYIALWLRHPGGAWITPSEISQDTVRIGSPYKQVVPLFDPLKAIDTVEVFNGSLLLWKDGSYSGQTSTDYTLQIDNYFISPTGMVSASAPFKFINPEPTLPFFIGFKLNSLPVGTSIIESRIYIIKNGNASVVYDTRIDFLQNIIYFKTDDLSATYIAMVDTEKPSISVVDADINLPIISTESLNNTLFLKDNISNLRYSFYFGKGNEVPSLRQTDTLSAPAAQINFTVFDTMRVISSESGLRALAIVTDGVHFDTLNLSRSVKRGESDPMTTIGGAWNPVFSTAELQYKGIDSLVSRLGNDTILGYDNRYMRFFRWVNYAGNIDSSEKWVEYDTVDYTVKELFSLEPGTIIWLKTLENRPLHLDSGYTMSPGDTFELVLPPRQWTDFGMPFRFAVPLSEIFKITEPYSDYIDIYQWNRDITNNVYTLLPYFIHGSANQPADAVLEYSPKGGYCIFNNHVAPVTLRIPGTLPQLVTAKKSIFNHRHGSTDSWGVTLSAKSSDERINENVYCGYARGINKRLIPIAPSFSSVRVMLLDRDEKSFSSFCVGEGNADGFIKEVIISNKSKEEQVLTWNLTTNGNLPKGYYSSLYEPKKRFESSDGIITVPENSTLSRFIVTGDASFHTQVFNRMISLDYQLHSPFPNPARSNVAIKYSVPAGSHERIKVSIYSVAGHLLWSSMTKKSLKKGVNTIIWNGRNQSGVKTASGVYVIKLDVLSNNNLSLLHHFEQRLTYLR